MFLGSALSLVAYRDYGDSPEFEVVDFTTDVEAFRQTIGGLRADGGGDLPEAVNEAIHIATLLDWNPSATARMTFVIGDAPPHPNEAHSAVQSAATLACGGVKVFTVSTTGQDAEGRYIFRQMSQLSYATHLFLLRDGITADGECSDHQFHTDDLHSIVTERALGELESRRHDALEIPGLGEDRDTELAAILDECAAQASEAGGEELLPVIR